MTTLQKTFIVPPSERYGMRKHMNPFERLQKNRKSLEQLTTTCSICEVGGNAPGSPVSSLGIGFASKDKTPKKKKSVKDSDVFRSGGSRQSHSTDPGTPRSSAPHYLAVNFYCNLHFYDSGGDYTTLLQQWEFYNCVQSHEINAKTATADFAEIVVGFHSGAVAVVLPFGGSLGCYFNKDKVVDSGSVTFVKWLPGSDFLFLVGHETGCMYVYDSRISEEANFNKDFEHFAVQSQSKPKCNPLVKWSVTTNAVLDAVFSPSGKLVAIPNRSSSCHVASWEERKLCLVFRSNFGNFISCAWSPDERYLATGGEDDRVTIFDTRTEAAIAHCVGHQSWVSGVAFDPWRSERMHDQDGEEGPGAVVMDQPPPAPPLTADIFEEEVLERYRLISVGQDGRVMFWDFEPGDERVGSASPASGAAIRDHSGLPLVATPCGLPTLDPVAVQRVHYDPITHLSVSQEGFLTVGSCGEIKKWTTSPVD